MTTVKVCDRVYYSQKNNLKMHVYVLADSKMEIPSRKLQFLSKPKELEYITAFNNRYHLEYLKDYSNHPYSVYKMDLKDLISYCRTNKNGILIMDNMYCDTKKKNTIFKAISLEYKLDDFAMNNHFIIYVP